MDAAQTSGGPQESSIESPGAAVAPGLLDNATALWSDLKGLAHDHLELAALETRRAGESLVTIIAFGIAVGVLCVTAWLGVIAALVLWLVDRGLAASLAVLLAVALNLVGAFAFVLAIKRTSKALRFPATVRALKPGGGSAPSTEAA